MAVCLLVIFLGVEVVLVLLAELGEHVIVSRLLLLVSLAAYGCPQQLLRLLVLVSFERQVGLRRCEFALLAVGERRALEFREYVVGVVEPVHLRIATREPDVCLGHTLRLLREVLGDVGECADSAEEVALVELCLAVQQPDLAHLRIVLLLLHELHVLRVLRLACLFLRLYSYGMEFLRLGRFLYGPVHLREAERCVGVVAYRVQGDDFRVVVLAAGVEQVDAFLVALLAVEVDVVSCRQRVVTPCHPVVFLGTRRERQHSERNCQQACHFRGGFCRVHSVCQMVCKSYKSNHFA